MRPFEQFRVWGRRAPVGERWAAAVVVTLTLAGLLWLAVPPSSDSTETTGIAAGPGSQAPSAAATGGAAVSPSGPIATGAAGTANRDAGGSGGRPSRDRGCQFGRRRVPSVRRRLCVATGSDQGVTDKEIKVAVIVVELAGAAGNETLNVPPPDEQRGAWSAMADELNKTGGVACRKVNPVFFTVNPLDQSNLRQRCLDVVQARVFYVIDIGGYAAYPAFIDCYVQNKIPFYIGNFVPQAQIERSYPYLFATSIHDNLYYNTALALKELGFFDPAKGFKKLGFFYQDCIPEHPQKYLRWLQQVGVPSSQIVSYSFGCPSAVYASPADIAQVVLQFQQEGVTHVTHVRGDGDWYNFTRAAQQQGFKPKYGFGDVSASYSAYGTLSPDWQNADSTILITSRRFNEERTPGHVPTAVTQRCQRIMAADGQPDMYRQKLGMGGIACNYWWFLAHAVAHAPELKRTALAEGLARGGAIEFSYPHGPASFPTPQTTYGGNFWRPLTARADCSCWRVVDPTFRPTFPGFQ